MAKSKNKKSAKPAKKKTAAKKPAKKVVKKPAKAKKAAKPAKKVVAKKPAKKNKPTSAKASVGKKVSKPAKKVVAKKVVAKPTKKVEDKRELKPTKPVAPAKPIIASKPMPPKSEKAVKAKKAESMDDDDDSGSDRLPTFAQQYQPVVVKKIDKNPPKPFVSNDKRTRYSDKELLEFKAIIHHKLDEAERDYETLKATLSHKDDHGTDDTSPTFKLLEDGSDVLSKEETAQLASRQEKYIQNLRNALIRIENKTYGICRVTGKLISKERLRSVPHATMDIDAKLEQAAREF